MNQKEVLRKLDDMKIQVLLLLIPKAEAKSLAYPNRLRISKP